MVTAAVEEMRNKLSSILDTQSEGGAVVTYVVLEMVVGSSGGS